VLVVLLDSVQYYLEVLLEDLECQAVWPARLLLFENIEIYIKGERFKSKLNCLKNLQKGLLNHKYWSHIIHTSAAAERRAG